MNYVLLNSDTQKETNHLVGNAPAFKELERRKVGENKVGTPRIRAQRVPCNAETPQVLELTEVDERCLSSRLEREKNN